ncbi:MAG: hypothetical protein P8I91_08675, partial [Phycisphaerales bacterium]|nr:hypothetical protein [Phycisphaerales bacterium]
SSIRVNARRVGKFREVFSRWFISVFIPAMGHMGPRVNQRISPLHTVAKSVYRVIRFTGVYSQSRSVVLWAIGPYKSSP